MVNIRTRDSALAQVLADEDCVLDAVTASRFLSKEEVRWRISSGRWQRACRGVLVTHSGPLTESQALRVAVLAVGPKAALAGLTAAWLGGFTGFGSKDPFHERTIHVLAPPGRKPHLATTELPIIMHYSRMLTDDDVYPHLEPRRTRMARSLVDAASWMPTDRGAMAVLAAGVQQRKTRVPDLRDVLDRNKRIRRHTLMYGILGDIEGGAQALSELDFTRMVIRQFRLPEPSRQVGRKDARGRQQWIDVLFDEWKVVVEIDGAQHREPLEHWDDMDRDNDLNIDGYRVLRFPAWLVRKNPELVARKILQALHKAGYRGQSVGT